MSSYNFNTMFKIIKQFRLLVHNHTYSYKLSKYYNNCNQDELVQTH